MRDRYIASVAKFERLSNADRRFVARKIAARGQADYSQAEFLAAFGPDTYDAYFSCLLGPLLSQEGYQIQLKVLKNGTQGCEVSRMAS